MDKTYQKIYGRIDEYRQLYFKALENKDASADQLNKKISELEQEIESKLSKFETHDLDSLIKKLKENVEEATESIDQANKVTKGAANAVKTIDNVLTFIRDIL